MSESLDALREACRAAAAAARQGRPEVADDALRRAAGLRDAVAEPLAHGLYHLGASITNQAAGDPVAALRHAEQAVTLLPPGADLAEATGALATARLLLGDHAAAESAFERAIQQYEALDHPLAAVGCRANLALVLKARGRYSAALGMLEAVRATLQDSDQPAELARLELNRAALLTEVGRCEAARHAADEALRLFETLGEAVEAARCRWAAAAAAEGLRLYEEALAGYHAAHEVLAATGHLAEAAALQINIGDVYRRLGDPALALRALDSAAPALAEGQPAHRATMLLNRAAVLAEQHLDEPALAALGEAVELFRRLDLRLEAAEAELLRAQLQTRAGDAAAAENTLLQAAYVLATSGGLHEAAAADLQRAELAREQGRLSEADEIYWAVLGRAPEALADLRWRAFHGLCRTAAVAGEPRRALEHGLAAVGAMEQLAAGLRHDLLRLGFETAPDHGELFGDVLRLCSELDDGPQAFAVLQRAKARSLVQGLSAAELPAVEPDADWYREEQALAVRINGLLANASAARGDGAAYQRWAQELAEARRSLYELHLRLAASEPEAAALRGVPVGGGTLDEVRGLLPTGTALLESYTAGEDLWLLAIDAEGLEAVHLPGRMSQVHGLLAQFEAGLAVLANTPPELWQRLVPSLHVGAEADLRELYDCLLAPLADRLEGAERLVIAPHDRLWSVPFGALHDGLEPLIDTVEIGLVPSAEALVRLHRRAPAAGEGGLAVGGDQRRLPAVEAEIEAVCGLLAMQRLAGPDATRRAVLDALGGARWVHYSGHAEFRPESPLFSSLHLAEGEHLTAADLLKRRLSADLVTLAACETGRHDGASSVELVGLARAFLQAGAKTVVATLWSAPDLATGRLMASFYRQAQALQHPAAALRQAQQAVRDETLHPFFWAGFAAIGLPWRDQTRIEDLRG